MNNTIQSLAIPFFSAAGWEDARTYMQDGHGFMASYAEFLQRVAQFENEMRRQGLPTVRVQIEREPFLAWCKAHGCQIDAQARSAYAASRVLQGHGNG